MCYFIPKISYVNNFTLFLSFNKQNVVVKARTKSAIRTPECAIVRSISKVEFVTHANVTGTAINVSETELASIVSPTRTVNVAKCVNLRFMGTH